MTLTFIQSLACACMIWPGLIYLFYSTVIPHSWSTFWKMFLWLTHLIFQFLSKTFLLCALFFWPHLLFCLFVCMFSLNWDCLSQFGGIPLSSYDESSCASLCCVGSLDLLCNYDDFTSLLFSSSLAFMCLKCLAQNHECFDDTQNHNFDTVS